MTTMAKNYNCDGSHCIKSDSEVRLYPLGGGANLILCKACFRHENDYRHTMERTFQRPDDWPRVDWDKAKPYPEQQQ